MKAFKICHIKGNFPAYLLHQGIVFPTSDSSGASNTLPEPLQPQHMRPSRLIPCPKPLFLRISAPCPLCPLLLRRHAVYAWPPSLTDLEPLPPRLQPPY